MHSALFEQTNLEVQADQRFALQNPQMLRVHLGGDILASKGAMIAYQGQIRFDHEKTGTMGKLLKKVVFAAEAGYVFLIDLTGDALSVNARNLLAFDSTIDWDIKRVQGAATMSGGLFNTTLRGHGTVAVHSVGQPVILDCSQQPTYVDVQSCVGWSASLVPQVVTSMNVRSMLRGGSGEAFQYAFHGPGFVVVQPSEWATTATQNGGGFNLGGLLDG